MEDRTQEVVDQLREAFREWRALLRVQRIAAEGEPVEDYRKRWTFRQIERALDQFLNPEENTMDPDRAFERFVVVAVRTYEKFEVAYLGRWGWEDDVDLDRLTEEDYERLYREHYGDIRLEATTRDTHVKTGSGHSAAAELVPIKFYKGNAWPVGTVVDLRGEVVGHKEDILDTIRSLEQEGKVEA